ncbi:MAG: hypothetical protein P1V97_38095, partial [Planctomycetota bacterium]|nr:hypothetical protein [Planctomycetota bacterium]
TRFLEAISKSEWDRARKLYEDEFLPRHGMRAKTQVNRLRYAKACSKLTKKDQETARGILEGVLREDGRQLEAMLLLAVLEAERGELEESKALLLQVAETGYNPLSEIYDKGSPLIKTTDDSLFILGILRAQRHFEFPESGIATIFHTLEEEKSPAKKKNKTVIVRKVSECVLEIENLLDSLEKALEAKEEASSAKLFEQFVSLLQRSRPLLSDIVIIRFENRLRRYQGLYLTLQFQLRRSKGIVILRSLERASRGKKFDEVVKLFHSMTILVNDLHAFEHESFQRLAELLSEKALTFKVKAEKKKLIAELSLNVTGIILDQRRLDSRGHKNHRAIINDKIYKAGDEVTDKRGEPVRGLRVVDIEKGTVKFRFHQEDFVRVLLAR